MAYLKVVLEDKVEHLEQPKSLEIFKENIKKLFGLKSFSIEYIDEEDELITASTELEFEEALNFAIQENKPLTIKPTGDFISDIEMVESQFLTENSEPRKEAPCQATPSTTSKGNSAQVKTQIKGSGPEKKEQSISTFPVNKAEVSSQHLPALMLNKQVGYETAEVAQNTASKLNQSTLTNVNLEQNQNASKHSFEDMVRNIIRNELEQVNPKKSQVVHEGVTCSRCYCENIVGARYWCSECLNFNLCEDCEERIEHDHALLKIKKPKEKQDDLKSLVNYFINTLGFTDEKQIIQALEQTGFDVDAAAEVLLLS